MCEFNYENALDHLVAKVEKNCKEKCIICKYAGYCLAGNYRFQAVDKNTINKIIVDRYHHNWGRILSEKEINYALK